MLRESSKLLLLLLFFRNILNDSEDRYRETQPIRTDNDTAAPTMCNVVLRISFYVAVVLRAAFFFLYCSRFEKDFLGIWVFPPKIPQVTLRKKKKLS